MSLSRQVTQPPFRERKVKATSAFVGPSTLLVFEAAAGSSAGLATDSIFYGLDSYKVQKQQLGGQVNVRHLFRGLLPLTMMGTVPSFGMFFFFYEPCKRVLADVYGLSDSASVALASFAAGLPASLIYVPADTVKKVCRYIFRLCVQINCAFFCTFLQLSPCSHSRPFLFLSSSAHCVGPC